MKRAKEYIFMGKGRGLSLNPLTRIDIQWHTSTLHAIVKRIIGFLPVRKSDSF